MKMRLVQASRRFVSIVCQVTPGELQSQKNRQGRQETSGLSSSLLFFLALLAHLAVQKIDFAILLQVTRLGRFSVAAHSMVLQIRKLFEESGANNPFLASLDKARPTIETGGLRLSSLFSVKPSQ